MIDFTTLVPGKKYSRPELARLWGYKSFNAISRGVFTPQGMNALVFFITKEKQEALTQYQDHIDADVLFWEGEKGHGNDQRIIDGRDAVHVFYRDRHHSPFIYKGRALLRSHHLYTDRPSKFVFQLVDMMVEEEDVVAEIKAQYGIAETEKDAIIKSRIGQGLYRKKAIELWQSCSVTSFTKEDVLIASHIKPWKASTNDERLNPFNSLILVPTLDKLFDKGYIGFDQRGKVMLSDVIGQADWDRIGIRTDMKLRKVPEGTKEFLDYHGEYIFDLIASK